MSVILALAWIWAYCTYIAAPLDLSAWVPICRMVM